MSTNKILLIAAIISLVIGFGYPIFFLISAILFIIRFVNKSKNKKKQAQDNIKNQNSNNILQNTNESNICKNPLKQKSNITNFTLPSISYSLESHNDFISLDTETTGLSPEFDKIIEISALKYIDGKQVDTYNTLINPEIHIADRITAINSITDEMVKNSPTINMVLPQLIDFIGQLPLVAHNASFDIKFLNVNIKKYLNKFIDNEIVDTLKISKILYPNLPNHKLETIKKYLGIDVKSHRANTDAMVAAQVYLNYCQDRLNKHNEMLRSFDNEEIKTYNAIKQMLKENKRNIDYLRCRHTGNYLDIDYLYTMLRIKLKGKKHYIISNLNMDQIKSKYPNSICENCVKSEAGNTRILINSTNEILNYKDIIINSYDELAAPAEVYLKNPSINGVKEYLENNLK